MNYRQKHILVVDDDKEIVDKVKIALTVNLKWDVDIAYDGKEALKKLKEGEEYDLLIIAVLIPKLSGIEVCESMVHDEKLKKIPVLLISVLPLYSDTFRASMEKFDELSVVKGVLEKPFLVADLMVNAKAIFGEFKKIHSINIPDSNTKNV